MMAGRNDDSGHWRYRRCRRTARIRESEAKGLGRLFDTLLQTAFMDMVPPGLAAAQIHRQPTAGKKGPSAEFVGIFPEICPAALIGNPF